MRVRWEQEEGKSREGKGGEEKKKKKSKRRERWGTVLVYSLANLGSGEAVSFLDMSPPRVAGRWQIRTWGWST